jgi:phospholipase A1/A2
MPSRAPRRAPAAFTIALALVAVAAQAAEDVSEPTASTADASPAPTVATRSALFSLYGANYLIIGPENSPVAGNVTSKFQLSLKYDTGAHWYLAYTQRVYWDITGDSQPILDMSVQPELFYLWQPVPERASRWHLQDGRAGFVHESNGKDGNNSRSWNRAYLEPHFRWGGLFLEPRVWAILDLDEQNRDLADYYGYLDLKFGYETASRQRFTVTGRHGSKHGSVQLDASLPLQSLWANGNMRPWLYAQAWAGYGETLLYYNVRTYAFRIGLEFHP